MVGATITVGAAAAAAADVAAAAAAAAADTDNAAAGARTAAILALSDGLFFAAPPARIPFAAPAAVVVACRRAKISRCNLRWCALLADAGDCGAFLPALGVLGDGLAFADEAEEKEDANANAAAEADPGSFLRNATGTLGLSTTACAAAAAPPCCCCCCRAPPPLPPKCPDTSWPQMCGSLFEGEW